jgi:hypothetical protein
VGLGSGLLCHEATHEPGRLVGRVEAVGRKDTGTPFPDQVEELGHVAHPSTGQPVERPAKEHVVGVAHLGQRLLPLRALLAREGGGPHTGPLVELGDDGEAMGLGQSLEFVPLPLDRPAGDAVAVVVGLAEVEGCGLLLRIGSMSCSCPSLAGSCRAERVIITCS